MAKNVPPKVHLLEIAGVSSLAARITPMGFVLVVTCRTTDDKTYLIDLHLDWSWFPVLAGKLNELLEQRDAMTAKFRSALWGSKD